MSPQKAPLRLIFFLVVIFFTFDAPSNIDAANTTETSSIATKNTDNTPRLVLEAGGHFAMIRELLFTSDGRELVSVSDDKNIRIWSVSPDGKQAALVRTIRGQIEDGRAGQIFAGALSPPDSKGRQRWLAVGGYLAGPEKDRNAIRLHDYASGEVRALMHGHTDNVLALAFSPSGRWLASAGKDRTVQLWDLSKLQKKRIYQSSLVLRGHTDRVRDLAWSASGERLASASFDHTVGLWDTASLAQGKGNVNLIARLAGHTEWVLTVAFHPDEAILASGGGDRTIHLGQADDGKALGVFANTKHNVSALAFSPDGRLMIAGNFPVRLEPKHLTLLAYPSGKTQRVFTGHDDTVIAAAFHPDGRWIASGGGNHKEILLWSVVTGEILSRLEGRGRTIYAVAFSSDGRYISWGQTSDFSSINNRGPLEQRFDLEKLERMEGGLSRSEIVRAQERAGKISLESGGPNNNQRLHVKQGWKRIGTIERGKANGYWHSGYTLTPDGNSVLSGGQNGELRLYALEGKTLARLIGHTGEIKAVAVSADGRWALSGSNDQTIKLWNLAKIPSSDIAEIVPTITLFPTTDGEWIAWTPDGFFAASAKGSHSIGYSINQGPGKKAKYVSVDQLYDRFYRPDLLYAKLHGDSKKLWQQKEASTNVKTVLAGGLAPRVAFIEPMADTSVDQQILDARASVMDQGGGIGKVVWKINEVTVATDTFADSLMSRTATNQGQPKHALINLKQQLKLAPGDNTIKLTAYNRQNEVASPPAVMTLTVKPPAAPQLVVQRPPATTLVSKAPSVSTSMPPTPVPSVSKQPILHLLVVGINRYRDKALRLKYAVQDGRAIIETIRQTGAPLFRQVRATPLFDDQATLKGLESAFRDAKKTVRTQDVFMLYLAGHGVTLDGRYYFLPQDFRYYNEDAVRTNAINQEHLQRWLAGVPARKSLVLIDTCESGSFSQSLVAVRGMAEKTAIAKLTRATGRATIVASTDEQPAAEGYRGHGVFTYVLLQALRHADGEFGNRDGYTGLFELAAYVNDQVPSITMDAFNFEQIPQVHMVGTDFPIGVVKKIDS